MLRAAFGFAQSLIALHFYPVPRLIRSCVSLHLEVKTKRATTKRSPIGLNPRLCFAALRGEINLAPLCASRQDVTTPQVQQGEQQKNHRYCDVFYSSYNNSSLNPRLCFAALRGEINLAPCALSRQDVTIPQVQQGGATKKPSLLRWFCLAPPAGLEPATP